MMEAVTMEKWNGIERRTRDQRSGVEHRRNLFVKKAGGMRSLWERRSYGTERGERKEGLMDIN